MLQIQQKLKHLGKRKKGKRVAGPSRTIQYHIDEEELKQDTG